MSKNIYTVFVGGFEVNDYYMTEQEAKELADKYMADGYEDVEVQ